MQSVRAIAAGGAHTAAVTESSVYSWGSNSAGQLGSRTFRDKAAPTEVKDLTAKGVVQVACGSEHSLFLCRRAPPASAVSPDTYIHHRRSIGAWHIPWRTST